MLRAIDDTICALATPPGIGGIGVIRVSGPGAFPAVDAVTQGKTSCARWSGHTLHRAWIRDADGGLIDDVLLGVFHAPRSYTGENVVEISAHGGPIPLGRILGRLLSSGTRLAAPGEFTLRAFLNGKMDLAQAEAVGDIIAAQTDRAHRLAQAQQSGQLSAAVQAVRDIVLGLLARIEASIDFPEDVGELDAAACRAGFAEAETRLQALLATADCGILYRQGVQVVLVGRPNVGKSSLLNALLRTARALVTPFPGTTRDTIEESLNLRGVPLRVLDTAGLRESEDVVEQMGVARTRQSLAGADLAILVLDAAAGETPEDAALRADLAGRPFLVVWNKWDLVASGSDGLAVRDGIAVSAATGWNIESLEDAMAAAVLEGKTAPQERDAAVVTDARHRTALQTARLCLQTAHGTLEAGLPADFVSVDVRAALTALGEITGETAGEDVLNEIFSRFCIGK